MPSWTELPFSQARDFLLRKKVLHPDDFAALYAEERATAFSIAGVNRMDVLQHVLDSLGRAVSEGTTLADFAKNFDEVLSTAGLDPVEPWRGETIFRTGIQSAYGRGRWEQMTDPDIASEVFGWRYLTVGDDRVREEHAMLEGVVFATGEGTGFFPPWDFNCRCSSEVVLNSEAEAEGISESRSVPPESFAALSESDFTSPAIDYSYRPDLTGFDAGLVNQYLAEKGDRGL